MSVDLRSGSSSRPPVNGTGLRVAIVSSHFNSAIVDNLVTGARRALEAHGVRPDDVDVIWVPGALEIPQVAKVVAEARRHDAIVALGAVIKGDTYHFEVVCDASAAGLMHLSMVTDIVITNGILTVYDEEQARVRSGEDDRNKGYEVAMAALETVVTVRSLST